MKTKSLLIFGILLVLTSFISAANYDYGYGMMGMMSGAYGFGFGILGGLIMILIIVALVLLIVWLVKQIDKKNGK